MSDEIHYFKANSTASLARYNITNILKYGIHEQRRVGQWCMHKDEMLDMIETHNVVLELSNPANCISSQHCLGVEIETEDYLLGLNPGYVHYSPWSFYRKWLEPVSISSDGKNQIYRYPYTYGERGGRYIFDVAKKLIENPTSRQVIVNLWEKQTDLHNTFVPCTIQWAFDFRDDKLHMTTTMRSQDACRGFFLDTFAYPLIQQFIANMMGLKMGTYTHIILNSHIYSNDVDYAERIVKYIHPIQSLNLPQATTRENMETMQKISDLIFIENNTGTAEKLFDSLPDFWRNWKASQVIYAYTRYVKKDKFPVELTIAGAIVNVLPKMPEHFLGDKK